MRRFGTISGIRPGKSLTLGALAASAILTAPLVSVAIATGAQTDAAPAATLRPLPEGHGKVVMEQMCVSCHALSVVTSKRATPPEWSALVQQMVARGAVGSDLDIAALTQYLAGNFGPGAPAYALPTAPPVAPTITPDKEALAPAPRPETNSGIHVNVNRAGVRELKSALGLTREEAQTLIAYRQQNGPFDNWQQVGEIPGVPAGKIIEHQDRIEF